VAAREVTSDDVTVRLSADEFNPDAMDEPTSCSAVTADALNK